MNSVDQLASGTYLRVLAMDHVSVGVMVVQRGTMESPELGVDAIGSRITPKVEGALQDKISEILGLNVNMTDFYSMAALHPKLDELVSRFRGMKPPRFPSIFETLVNAIACQQVSLNVGLLLISRLSQKHGLPLDIQEQQARSFPTADAISRMDSQELRGLGFSNRKAGYLLGLARSVSAGRLDLESLHRMEDREAVEFLMQIRGVGRWSAEYTLLRGLGRLNVFPGDDVGGQNSLRRWMGLHKVPDYEKVQQLLEKWRDFRGLVYFHLLLKGLEEKGYLDPFAGTSASPALGKSG